MAKMISMAYGSGDPERISYGKPAGDGFKYALLHGIGPGTKPEDVGIIKIVGYDNGIAFVWFDRVLSTKELTEYDIPSETELEYYEKICNES